MSNYTVTIEHCNSIEKASVSIEKETLNIKYGSNGLGKSSIARAIQLAVNDADSLKSLKPFKYRKDPNQYNPKVTGLENVGSVQIFDEAYVSQFVFQKDEVLKNSFDIFIRTDTYVAAMTEMEELFSGIRGSFDGDSNIESAIGDLKELRDAFGLTKAGGIAKTSKGYKAFGSGNKIENIPDGLVAYGDFIRSDQPAAWISWQTKGNAFSDLSHNCPYCSSDLQQGDKKDAARLVAKEYDSKAIEHLSGLQAIIKRLGKYFETGCRASLDGITRSNVELSPEAETFLTSLRGAVETLLFKLEGLRSISFYALRDVE
jgi:energy-coupling factor transporter ATP-binding protein EcfA2